MAATLEGKFATAAAVSGEVLDEDLWSPAYRAVPDAERLPDLSFQSTGESLEQAAACLADTFPMDSGPAILFGPPRTGMPRIVAAHSIRTPMP